MIYPIVQPKDCTTYKIHTVASKTGHRTFQYFDTLYILKHQAKWQLFVITNHTFEAK